MVVSFTSTSTGNPTGYSWTFGNGNTSTAQNPTTSYTLPGVYTVTLTVTGPSGSNTKTQTSYITVKQVPTVTFSASPTSACPGAPITFSPNVTWNAPGTGTYHWDFGDGGTSSSASPTHRYANSGTYTVKLTAINSVGCPATDTQANLISIYPAPVASFIASDTAICSGSGTTTFTSTSTGSSLSYVWDFGDGTPVSTAGSPIAHTYGAPGIYNVKLIATNGTGCSDTIVRNSYIHVRVIAAGFMAPSTICQGASAPMSTTTAATPGAAISWNFGDGNTGTGSTVANTYTSAGTFAITQTATIGSCTATAASSITVHPKPAVSFSFSPLAPCPATVNVQFTNNAATGVTYNWFFGDGTTGVGTSPAHWYTYNDTFTVTLNGYNSFGCSGSAIQSVTILPMALFIKADKTEGCAPLSVNFTDSLVTFDDHGNPRPYPHSIAAYYWDFGDGGTSTSASPTHIYVNPGSYLAQLRVTTSNGCVITDSIRIRAGNKPNAVFGASPRVVCVDEPVSFRDSSTTTGLPITDWIWEFGDGKRSLTRHPFHSYSDPDTFDVTLYVGVNGCWDTLTKPQHILVNFPKSVMQYRVSCDTPLFVEFKNLSVGATSHAWYFGDGTGSGASNPGHRYGSPGIYQAVLVTNNSVTGCTDSQIVPINLNPAVLSITAFDTTICRLDSLRLNATVGGGGIATAYSWWIGTGSSSPSFFYGSPKDSFRRSYRIMSGGSYHVALEIKDQNGCRISTQKRNYITVGAPAVRFTAAPPVGCLPYATITFRDSTTHPTGTYSVNRVWNFGDGTGGTTTLPTISHPYTATGSYGISLKVTDNIGCSDSLSLVNFLNVSNPRAIFSTTGTNACERSPFNFFSSSSGVGLKYDWSFGDGGTSTASSPSYTYAAIGSYTVRLIVTDNIGCKDTMTKPSYINVNGRPQAAFDMDDTINVCPPLIVNFTNKSTGAVRYAWSFGTGATSILTNPSNTYIAPQVYTIRLVATNAVGCNDTAYGRARVMGYAGVLSYSPLTGCAPLTVNFVANNVDGVAGFIFDFGDGSTAASTTPRMSHVYTKPGPHIPKITLTDNLGCSVTSMGTETIKVDGVHSGFTFSPFPACDNGTINFIDTSRGAYSALNAPTWRFHDGSVSTLLSPSRTYPSPGTYPVTLYSSTVSGCKDTLYSSVTFHPLPRIDAGPDTLVCLTDSATLQPSGGVSYVWAASPTLSCTGCTNPQAFPKVQTRYVVVGTDVHGCKNKDSVTVRLRTKTTATVSPGAEICSGESLALSASGGGTYEWSPPTGLSDPNIANPVANPGTTQNYTVITRLASCIPDTDYVEIIVHPTPTVDAGKDQTMIAGNPVQLRAIGSSFITIWNWSPPDGLSCDNCGAPEAAPKRTTTYTVRASTDFGCEATDSVRVTVLCDNNQVYIPNTFTPEGNGVNDVFYPRGRGLQVINRFRIYDRWGEVVFERTNMAVDDRTQGWDGKKGGRLLSPDVYVYTVEALCDTGEPIKWKGDVMLLR